MVHQMNSTHARATASTHPTFATCMALPIAAKGAFAPPLSTGTPAAEARDAYCCRMINNRFQNRTCSLAKTRPRRNPNQKMIRLAKFGIRTFLGISEKLLGISAHLLGIRLWEPFRNLRGPSEKNIRIEERNARTYPKHMSAKFCSKLLTELFNGYAHGTLENPCLQLAPSPKATSFV